MQQQTQPVGPSGLDPAFVRKIKIGVIAALVLGVAVLAFFIVREIREERVGERWDAFAQIQDRYELEDRTQDPLFETGPDATPYIKQRGDYIAALEAFLPEAESEDDALAPHVHWLIARLSADQIIVLKDEIDPAVRRTHWDRAAKHMQVIVDRYPDFQVNWSVFAPAGQASQARAFLATVAANIGWEAENLPKPMDPASDTVVVVRTERGDLRIGLFSEQAPELTALFIERATRGDYDGTAFYAKTDQRPRGNPANVTIRAGHPATRGAKPFDKAASKEFADEEYADHMPAPTRNLMPIDRGIVCAWHDPATDYDGPQAFFIAMQRSPQLDYVYSPIGKLLDVASQDTAARIFLGEVWRDDTTISETPEEDRAVADFLQAPVKIVKVLVYENGRITEPKDVSPNKVAVETNELTLAELEPDAYKVDPPVRPVTPPPEESGSETAPEETPPEPADGAGDAPDGDTTPDDS